ncbi:MAG: YciI family protein [Myxococcota bacterium]|nr:YciI family protein [Myxococcota bacterium]
MPLFALIGRDGPDGVALRRQHREAHLAHLERLAGAGRLRFAGPLRDGAGEPCGSLVLFEADDLGAALVVAAEDPYAQEGVFRETELHETLQVLPPEDA